MQTKNQRVVKMGVHSVFMGNVIPPSDESEGYRVEKLDLNTGESSGRDDVQDFLSRLNGEQVFVAISDVHHSLPQTASDLRSAIHWYEQNPRAIREELDGKEQILCNEMKNVDRKNRIDLLVWISLSVVAMGGLLSTIIMIVYPKSQMLQCIIWVLIVLYTLINIYRLEKSTKKGGTPTE